MAGVDDSSLTPEQHVNKIFRTALILGASLEWESGQPAKVWIEGVSRRLDMVPLLREKMESFLRSIMDGRQWETLEETGHVEFPHAPDVGGRALRVRVVTEGDQLRVEAHPPRQDSP